MPVELFLNFGFLSEKLLEAEEISYLLSCVGTNFTGSYNGGQIYTIRENSLLRPGEHDVPVKYAVINMLEPFNHGIQFCAVQGALPLPAGRELEQYQIQIPHFGVL